MKIYDDIAQGSSEWYEIRLGLVTGSIAATVQAKGRGGGPSLTRADEMFELALERIHNRPRPAGYKSADMIHGTETEPEARSHYELMEGVTVEQVGFVTLNDDVGCSPDGFVGDDGLIEIKCPKNRTQYNRFLASVFPKEYNAQIQFQLWVTGRKWCDFISFAPDLMAMKYFKIRVYPDQDYIDNMQYEVEKFVKELKILVETIGVSPF
jgi:putative phage-type endonuclease